MGIGAVKSAQLSKPPDEVTPQEVFAWAHGRGPSGKEPGPVTIGARMACLSSFYKFLIRMGAVASNPCDALERPRVEPSPPKGLSAEEVRRLLAVVPETPSALRGRALILTLAPGRDRHRPGARRLGREPGGAASGGVARADVRPRAGGAGRGVSSGTFYGNLRRYFEAAGVPPAGVYVLRHSAGDSVEQVSAFLDHSSFG